MPKAKSHRGAAKRFRRTGSGKIARNRANKQHILTKKRTKRKRKMRLLDTVDGSDEARVRRMLPYL